MILLFPRSRPYEFAPNVNTPTILRQVSSQHNTSLVNLIIADLQSNLAVGIADFNPENVEHL